MKVTNLSNNLVLGTDVKIVTTFSDKLLGLLKTSNLGGLMFKTRFGIHTFFLKTAIDVIVLDENSIVVKLKTVPPNRIYFWNPRFSTVIELPAGLIKKSKTKLGDTLILSTKKPLSF